MYEQIINGEKTLPHTHKGYIHNEKGDYNVSDKKRKIIDRVKSPWYNINGKK